MTSVDLNNLSIEDLKRIKKDKQQKIKKEFFQYKQNQGKQKLIADTKKIEKQRKNIKAKSKLTKPRVKTFDECFQECIKNKIIPPGTPPYRKKALERALKEYQQGIIKDKSALEDFAEKYTVDGEPRHFLQNGSGAEH